MLQPELSRYVQGSRDIDPITRRARHWMGDVARYCLEVEKERLSDAVAGMHPIR